MGDPELEDVFPGLASTAYEITIPDDPAYNCIAWALGDLNHFWYDAARRSARS